MPPPATPITHLHAYMLMMPPDQLKMELKLMNANLTSKKKQETTMGELLKFYGICILITRVSPQVVYMVLSTKVE
jgi:hypothetical protein